MSSILSRSAQRFKAIGKANGELLICSSLYLFTANQKQIRRNKTLLYFPNLSSFPHFVGYQIIWLRFLYFYFIHVFIVITSTFSLHLFFLVIMFPLWCCLLRLFFYSLQYFCDHVVRFYRPQNSEFKTLKSRMRTLFHIMLHDPVAPPPRSQEKENQIMLPQ